MIVWPFFDVTTILVSPKDGIGMENDNMMDESQTPMVNSFNKAFS